MANIIIPSPLRKHTDGKREVSVPGDNLKDVVMQITERHPGLESLFGPRSLVSVFINGSMLREKSDGWAGVTVADDDEITLIIPIAGG